MTSTKTAKLFGLYPKKGTIAVGSDADLVLFDPAAERTLSAETHHMAVDYNAFEGLQVTGEPVSVLSRGEFVVQDRKFAGRAGRGQYQKRAKYGELLDTSENAKISI
jgi:dihydropyrimidinase